MIIGADHPVEEQMVSGDHRIEVDLHPAVSRRANINHGLIGPTLSRVGGASESVERAADVIDVDGHAVSPAREVGEAERHHHRGGVRSGGSGGLGH